MFYQNIVPTYQPECITKLLASIQYACNPIELMTQSSNYLTFKPNTKRLHTLPALDQQCMPHLHPNTSLNSMQQQTKGWRSYVSSKPIQLGSSTITTHAFTQKHWAQNLNKLTKVYIRTERSGKHVVCVHTSLLSAATPRIKHATVRAAKTRAIFAVEGEAQSKKKD